MPRAGDRSRGARRVLPEGAAVRAGLGAHSQGGGLAVRRAASADNIPLALLGWIAGCTAIWSALFTVGNFLYMRPVAAGVLFAVFVVSALVLASVTRTLWGQDGSRL